MPALAEKRYICLTDLDTSYFTDYIVAYASCWENLKLSDFELWTDLDICNKWNNELFLRIEKILWLLDKVAV